MDRHGRQSRLAEVGSDGQARIARAVVDVRLDGLAADVAVRYLAGAGVGGLRVSDPSLVDIARAIAPSVSVGVDPSLAPAGLSQPLPCELRDPSARRVAQGAFAALRALRDAIEDGR